MEIVSERLTVPEEDPLQALVPLQVVLEAKLVLLVVLLQQVQHFGARLHDREGLGRDGVVDEDGDAAVGVQAQEPVFLLLVGHDVDEGGGPGDGGRAVGVFELLEHDLHGLAVGGVHGEEVEALGVLHLGGGFVGVEGSHLGGGGGDGS